MRPSDQPHQPRECEYCMKYADFMVVLVRVAENTEDVTVDNATMCLTCAQETALVVRVNKATPEGCLAIFGTQGDA